LYQSNEHEPTAKNPQPKIASVIVYAEQLPAALDALLRAGLLEIEIDSQGVIRFRPAARIPQ
jgi:hypothetical protein